MLKFKFSFALLFVFVSSFLTAQNYVINPTTDGGFEGVHGWTVLNTSNVNKWIIGSSEKSLGEKGAYVSSDNSTNTIVNPQDSNSRIYIYKDVIVPLNATSISISFKYKNAGADAPKPRCLFELTSSFPTMPTDGSKLIVGAEFATFLNNSTNWTTYTNNSPLSSDRLLTYTSSQLIPGESYRIVFEWSALYQTSFTQTSPITEYPKDGYIQSSAQFYTPGGTLDYTLMTSTPGNNFGIVWNVTGGGQIISGQGTRSMRMFIPLGTTGTIYTSLNYTYPTPTYASNGKNSGALSIDEVSMTFEGVPKITSIAPLSGAVGSSVTINGAFFGASAANNIVYLGGVKCPITDASESSITVTVPSNANFSNFTVLNTTKNLSCSSGSKFVPINTDLSGMSYNSNTLTSFEAPVTFTTGTFASSYDQKFVLADVDLDGKVDVFSYSSTGVPNVLRNNATSGIINSSSFVANTPITGVVPTSPSGRNVLTADLNNDGKLDFATNYNSLANGGFANINSSTSGTPSLLNFNSLLSSSNHYQVNASFLPIDINLDGRTDILGLNGSNATQALLYFTKNNTTGTTFSSVTGNTTNTNSYSQKLNDTNFNSGASGDLDGDGKMDVVLSGTGKVYVLKNNTTQGNPDVRSFSFSESVSKAIASGVANAVKVVDIDLDGKLDVIATNSTIGSVSVFRNNSTADNLSLADAQNFAITSATATNGLAVADMNGDGKPDLIVSDNSARIGYLENTSISGTISFANSVTIVSTGAYTQVEVADIDGDTKPDIIATNATNGIVVFRNRAAEAGTISADQTICYNKIPAVLTSSAAATFSAVGGTITYKWESSTNGTSWSAATGSTNALGYTPVTLTVNTYFRRAASHSAAPTVFYYTNPILITVTPNPTITSNIPVTACGNSIVSVSAISSGGVVKWYDTSTAGNLLETGNTYTTPSISTTKNYFAQAETGSGCLNSSRTQVTATIITTAPTISTSAGDRCDTGSVTLSASFTGGTSFGATVNWYTSATGGLSIGTGTSFVTPSISSTTTYYADATNCNGTSATRIAAIATVVNSPSVISTVPRSGCKNSNVVLSATASGTSTLRWYNVETAGSPLSSYATVSNITANTNRYVSAFLTTPQGKTCESPRTAVLATMFDLPATPTGVGASLCGTGSVTVSASSATGVISWYNSLTNGSLIGTGPTYTPPATTSDAFTTNNVNYFATATDIKGCVSNPRATVTVTYDGPKLNYISDLNAVTSSTNQKFSATGLVNQTSFIWQRSIDSGKTWQDITASLDAGITYSGFSGTTATTSDLTLSTVSSGMHKFQYRMKLIKSGGCENYSNVATLNVADVFGTCENYPALYHSVNSSTSVYSSYYHWNRTVDYWDGTVNWYYYDEYPYYDKYPPSSYDRSPSSLTDGDPTSGYNLSSNTNSITIDFFQKQLFDKVVVNGFSWMARPLKDDTSPYGEIWGYASGSSYPSTLCCDSDGNTYTEEYKLLGYRQIPDENYPLTTEYGPDWFNGNVVEISNDNINFTQLTVTSSWDATNHVRTFNFPIASARYVRLKNPNGNSGISELKVYYGSILNAVPYIKTLPPSPLYLSASGGVQTVDVTPAFGKSIENFQWSKLSGGVYTDLNYDDKFSGTDTNSLSISTFATADSGSYRLTANQDYWAYPNNGCKVTSTSTFTFVAPFYSSNAGSGALQTLGSWRPDPLGVTGTAPADFNLGKIFVLANSASTNYSLGAALTMGGTLRLNTNKLTLGAHNATIATLQEYSSSAYVITNGAGKLGITGVNSNPKLYPVGATSTTYNPVTISNNTGTADTYSVSVSNAVLTSGTSGVPLTNNLINRTWIINKTTVNTAGTGSDITFEWNDQTDVLGTVSSPKLYAYIGSASTAYISIQFWTTNST
jgi:hypothetical protein